MPWRRRMLCSTVSAVLLCTVACARDTLSPEGAHGAVARSAVAGDGRDDASGGDPSQSFEEFQLGAIDGQHDWQSTGGWGSGAAPGTTCATYDHVVAENAALAVPGLPVAQFGRRSLRLSNAVTSGCYSDQTFSHRAGDVAGEAGATSRSRDGSVDYARTGAQLRNRFDAEFTLFAARPSAWQAGLEIVASPARGDDHRMSWVQVADWADGLAVVFAERSDPASPGAFQRSLVVRGLDRGRAHTIRLTVDFADGPRNDVARVYVDGALQHTGGSWESYYHDDANGRANFNGATPAVNRLMFRTGSDTHRGVPGNPAPATRGYGFLIDAVRVAVYAVPRTAAQCRDDGWRVLRDEAGVKFRNLGACVSWTRSPGRALTAPRESGE